MKTTDYSSKRKKRKRVLWMMVVMTVLSGGVLAFTSTRRTVLSSPTTKRTKPTQNPIAGPNGKSEDYVRSSRLWPQLRWNLKAFGDRLEKRGKERLTLTGTLQRLGESQSVPVLLILEFPDHLRLQIQSLGPPHIITFNGKKAAKLGGSLDQSEADLIETLVYDTAEHFFAGRSQGEATRFLGERFRLDDSAQVSSVGPVYALYQTTEEIRHSIPTRQQTKLYCFNSDTHLLERVRYELDRLGSRISVEIRISGWRKLQDQQLPFEIVRVENNQPVLTLTINSATLGTKINDGAFGE